LDRIAVIFASGIAACREHASGHVVAQAGIVMPKRFVHHARIFTPKLIPAPSASHTLASFFLQRDAGLKTDLPGGGGSGA
jgi:hypothetical protein